MVINLLSYISACI